MEQKMYSLSMYTFNRLKQHMVDVIDDKNDEYFDVIDKLWGSQGMLTDAIESNNLKYDVCVGFGWKPVMPVDRNELEEQTLKYAMDVNHSIICHGYIRDLSKTITSDIEIPYDLYEIIINFYPKYDLLGLWIFDGPNITKYKLSAICDIPKVYQYDKILYYKTMKNKWYKKKDDGLWEDNLVTDSDIVPFKKDDNEMIEYLSSKNINTSADCYIDTIAFSDNMKIGCTNYGDVYDLNKPNDKTTFNAATFLINMDNKHYMIDILISKSEHVLFLTSGGNLFSFGQNNKGQCGVAKAFGVSIKFPRHLKELSLNFIKSIYCTNDSSLCLDRNDILYCFGNNENNKMGLNDDEVILWKPVIHEFFNKNNNDIFAKIIKCGNEFVCYIDNKNQCYWSQQFPSEIQSTQNMIHWQSYNDNEYGNEHISNIVFDPTDIDGNNVSVLLINIRNRMKFYGYTADGNKRDEWWLTREEITPHHTIEYCFSYEKTLMFIARLPFQNINDNNIIQASDDDSDHHSDNNDNDESDDSASSDGCIIQ